MPMKITFWHGPCGTSNIKMILYCTMSSILKTKYILYFGFSQLFCLPDKNHYFHGLVDFHKKAFYCQPTTYTEELVRSATRWGFMLFVCGHSTTQLQSNIVNSQINCNCNES